MQRKNIQTSGFTLAEVMVATVVALAVTLITTAALVQGVHVFKGNESTMWAREKGSKVIRSIQNDMYKATAIRIYPDYASVAGAESAYGSCIVLDLPDIGKSVAYYRSASNATPTSGSIYYDTNTTVSVPNPAADKALVSTAMDLEFRRNANGSVRVGFQLGTLGYPRRTYGSNESDCVRYTTSVVPRNL